MKTDIRQNTSRRSGFTMVEIALCLAIIGFALVAIIGVLPAGLNVQKENREETILNQDSTIWLDAIRSGSQGYDELTNYVDRIVITNFVYDDQLKLQGTGVTVAQHAGAGVTPNVYLNSGANVVGLLSTPKFTAGPLLNGFSSNVVYAYCRAISGSAVEKTPQQANQEVRDAAFAYRMMVDITRAGSIDPEVISTNATDLVLQRNLSDVRLFMRWPFKKPFSQTAESPPVADASRMTFRSQASGAISAYLIPDEKNPGNRVPLYFIQPRTYQ